MKTLTKEQQERITPSEAVQLLRAGNQRFINDKRHERDLLAQVSKTSGSQHPFAVILSCIDSRTPAELIFDQGLGDIFSIRLAGSVVNEDVLGCMEFSCALAGAKLIVVLGHTHCGAVMGACDNVKMENLTTLLSKLTPAVEAENTVTEHRDSSNSEFVTKVTQLHIKKCVKDIIARSQTLKEMLDHRKIDIIGGMHDITTGKVEFFD